MFEIKHSKMKLTKGDSASIKVDLFNDDGSAYTMSGADKLVLSVRKRPTSDVLLTKETKSNVVVLEPEDTALLEVGNCCFDVKLVTESGDVYTVVGVDDFTVSNLIVYHDIRG